MLGLLKYCKLQQHLQSQVLFHMFFLLANLSNKDSPISKIQYTLRNVLHLVLKTWFSKLNLTKIRYYIRKESDVACDFEHPAFAKELQQLLHKCSSVYRRSEATEGRWPPLECVKDQSLAVFWASWFLMFELFFCLGELTGMSFDDFLNLLDLSFCTEKGMYFAKCNCRRLTFKVWNYCSWCFFMSCDQLFPHRNAGWQSPLTNRLSYRPISSIFSWSPVGRKPEKNQGGIELHLTQPFLFIMNDQVGCSRSLLH